MRKRVEKFWRDHIFSISHDLELKLDLKDAPYRVTADQHGMVLYTIDDVNDPRLEMLDRGFPRQSRSFREDIEAGCLMQVLSDGTELMGYFFCATRAYYDRRFYRLTFPAGDGLIYAFNFYVDPRHRSKPVARVLLSEGFHQLHNAGFSELVAICNSDERALVRLYRQFKILPTGRAIDVYTVLHRVFSKWTQSRV